MEVPSWAFHSWVAGECVFSTLYGNTYLLPWLMVSATSWKLEPPVAWRVSRQRDKWFQHVFKSSELWGAPLLSFCYSTDPINHWLLRFSVWLTGSCWGGEWRGLRGQFKEKAASWETMPGFFKNKHPAPYNTHSGWSNPGAQRELLIWEDLRARRTVEKSSPSEHLQLRIESRLHWAWESKEVNKYEWKGHWNALLVREIIVK